MKDSETRQQGDKHRTASIGFALLVLALVACSENAGVTSGGSARVQSIEDPERLVGHTIEGMTSAGDEFCHYFAPDGGFDSWDDVNGTFAGSWRIDGRQMCFDDPSSGAERCLAMEIEEDTVQLFERDGRAWTNPVDLVSGDRCRAPIMLPVAFRIHSIELESFPDKKQSGKNWDAFPEKVDPDVYLNILVDDRRVHSTSTEDNLTDERKWVLWIPGLPTSWPQTEIVIYYQRGELEVGVWDEDLDDNNDHMGSTEKADIRGFYKYDNATNVSFWIEDYDSEYVSLRVTGEWIY